MRDRPLPPLHAVTDDAVAARADFAERAGRVLDAGGAAVALHLRAPGLGGRRLFELARALVPRAADAGALLFVNDRVDVALAAGAHGVQLGRRGIDLADARRMLGTVNPPPWLGASVHSAGEAREAAERGADFVVAGSIHPTASHPGIAPAGVGLVGAAAAAGVPVIAIGGMTPDRAADAIAAGAAGVAAIRGVWEARDEAEAVKRYLQAMERWT